MSSIVRWSKVALCAVPAILALGSTGANASAATATDLVSATTVSQALPGPVLQQSTPRLVTITVRSVYVHDDADNGPGTGYGCGEMSNYWIGINGDFSLKNSMKVSNYNEPDSFGPHVTQEWCSDTNYIPTDYSYGFNRHQRMSTVGSYITLNGQGSEVDGDHYTRYSGAKSVQIPAAGTSKEFQLTVEGGDSHGHARMTAVVRVSTS